MNFNLFKKKKRKYRKRKKKTEKSEENEQKSAFSENILKLKQWFREYKKSSDYSAITEIIGGTLCYGIPLSAFSAFLLSQPIYTFFIGIIPIGLFMVLFDKKLLSMLSVLLSSIRLVEVKR